MLAHHARLILGDAYASWEEGDVPRTLSYFSKDVVFAVHSSSDAPSLIGDGLGRDEFGGRLEMFLRQFDVENFALQRVAAITDRLLERFCHALAA